MFRKGDETHVSTDEARGAESPGVVRWVLLASLALAIGALTIVWVTGALTTG
jgi:hypothetical protein